VIERIVLLKLVDRGRRDEIAAEARRALPGLPGVQGVHVGVPADAGAEVWDLLFAVRFDTLPDVEAYLVHPDHVRFVEQTLLPNVEIRKAWNFTLLGSSDERKR
jgi:hypothetical protein